MSRRIMVAGIGNIFFGDDGFGSEVARRLAAEQLPDGVQVVDYGIRGMHLAYDLLDGYDALVIIDAVPRNGRPGDLVVIEVGPDDLGTADFDAHGMEPTAVLSSLGALGGQLPPTYVVGCQPADLNEGMGLSPRVAAAVSGAVTLVKELLETRLVSSASPAAELQPAAVTPDRKKES